MKKTTAYMLAILLLVFCNISVAERAEPVILQSGDFQYVLLDDGTSAIVRAETEGELIIPSELDGYTVSAVGLGEGYPMIKKVYDAAGVVYCEDTELRGVIGKKCTKATIPDSVKVIGEGAFIYCGNLTDVTLPEGLVKISDCAFERCRTLSSLTIPDSLTSIGGFAFAGSGLTDITIPSGVTKIDWWAFSDCRNLQSVTLQENLAVIGTSAFENCMELSALNIPNSVKNIGRNAFEGCEKLICTVAENSYAMRYCEGNGIQFAIDPESDGTIQKEGSVSQDAGLIRNGDYQYVLLEDETAAIITADVQGESMIPDELDGHPVSSVGLDRNAPNYKEIYMTAGLIAAEGEFLSRDGVFSIDSTSVTIPSGVKTIGILAFSKCDKLNTVVLPDGITEIEFGAFMGCKALNSVKIPDSVTTIGEMAFGTCLSLQSVVIPEGVTAIESMTFYGCEALTEVSIPASVISIAEDAFEGCGESLKCIVIKGSEAYNYCNKQGIQYELNDNKEE